MNETNGKKIQLEPGEEEKFYDVIVAGGGPAGLTAAIYLARARYRVLVVEGEAFGGQITITSDVVNYPGIERTDGRTLTHTMQRQAENFGTEFLSAKIKSFDLKGPIKAVSTDRGTFKSFGILIATGAHPRMVGFEGEQEFKGHGVAYCATCDGEFFTGKDVFVVGGGFAAAEESIFLTKYAKHVTILIRGDDFSCAKATSDPVYKNDKITVLKNVTVKSAEGDSALRRLAYVNTKTGEETVYDAGDDTFGIFVFVGYEPATDLIKDDVELTPKGYVVTDANKKTSVDGVYAAGDVCDNVLRQVVTAVGDGAIAAAELEKYAAKMQEETGIVPKQPVSRVPSEPKEEIVADEGGLFSADMKAQLNALFEKMDSDIVLKLHLDGRPVSTELTQYMNSIAELTPKIKVEIAEEAKDSDGSAEDNVLPYVQVCRADGSPSGLAFHGAPGGHEFTSFMIGLYNVAGPGQSVDEATEKAIAAIRDRVNIKILVSLSCTMCPELVTAAQKIAASNDSVNVDVFDLNNFGHLKDKYDVMSVPCFIINDDKVGFGKKNINELLDIIGE